MNENKTGKFRRVICALLFTATLINHMDRQVLGLEITPQPKAPL